MVSAFCSCDKRSSFTPEIIHTHKFVPQFFVCSVQFCFIGYLFCFGFWFVWLIFIIIIECVAVHARKGFLIFFGEVWSEENKEDMG